MPEDLPVEQAPVEPVIGLPEIEQLESALLQCESADISIDHTFAPGVYVRRAHFPAGVVAIGHEHKTKHISIISSGRFSILEDSKVRQVQAPAIFVSEPGVRKVAFFHEPTVWENVHPNPDNETSEDKLEERFIIKSKTWLAHALTKAELNQLTNGETA